MSEETATKKKTTKKKTEKVTPVEVEAKAVARTVPLFEWELKLEEHLAYFITNKAAMGFSPTQVLDEYKKLKPVITDDNIDDMINEEKLRSLCFTNRAKLGYKKEDILAVTKNIVDAAKTPQ